MIGRRENTLYPAYLSHLEVEFSPIVVHIFNTHGEFKHDTVIMQQIYEKNITIIKIKGFIL